MDHLGPMVVPIDISWVGHDISKAWFPCAELKLGLGIWKTYVSSHESGPNRGDGDWGAVEAKGLHTDRPAESEVGHGRATPSRNDSGNRELNRGSLRPFSAVAWQITLWRYGVWYIE